MLLLLLILRGIGTAQRLPPAEQIAQQVTIYRDQYGTPHVFGETDASTVFGFAYAQAGDNFAQVEEDFVLAIGRAAELYGPDLLNEDLFNRTLAIEEHAKDDYDKIDAHMRLLCDAYAAGINYYLARHTGVHPRVLRKIEPWYPLAFIRYSYYQNGFARDPKLGETRFRADLRRGSSEHNGSNGWVISPSRSASGHAMLFINPHLPFYGPGQVYEGHIHSDEGWEFSGYARFGFPFPYIGHNASLGWMSTDNAADMVDGYVEQFDDPHNGLQYRYGHEHKLAISKTASILVKGPNGAQAKTFETLWTIHGPIIGKYEGRALAARLPMYESHGWLREWYDMTKAHNLQQLIAALEPHQMLFGNVMSADNGGHIFYVYNAAIPKRGPRYDWSQPVDGSDPGTEWKGYYPFSALPQLTDPASGWMQNCNTSPFLLTSEGNPNPNDYPKYMVREGRVPGLDAQNPRGRASERVLTARSKFTFEEWAEAAFDTHVITADETLPRWLAMVNPDLITGESVSWVREAIPLLRSWDHVSRVESVPMAIYTLWHQAMRKRPETAQDLTETLQQSLSQLARKFGNWRTAYGELNRLVRSTKPAKPPFGNPNFDDNEPSEPIAAVNGNDGAVFTLGTAPGIQDRRRYGVHGSTYISVVEFGPKTRALSVMTFGESGDPASRHFVDQEPLYTKGQFKRSWFTLEEVRANAESVYHPGQEKQAYSARNVSTGSTRAARRAGR